jgi:hypothetical protein
MRFTWTLPALCLACGASAQSPSPAVPAEKPPVAIEPRAATPSYGAAEVDACAADMGVPESRGVLALPKTLMQSSLRPTYRALCACLPHGGEVGVRVRLTPEEGRSEAEVDEPALASCVRREMGAGTIPAFELGSDCIDCGPRHFDAWHGAQAPAKKPSSTLTLALRFVRP